MKWKLPGQKWAMVVGLLFVIGVGVAVYLSQRPPQGDFKPVASPAIGQPFHDLIASYREDCRRFSQCAATARTDAERKALSAVDHDAYARRAWALVQAAPGDPAALEAYCHIATYFSFSDEAPLALARLRDAYLHDARLGNFCPLLAVSAAPSVEEFLRTARTEHADAATRVRAALALATYLRNRVLEDHARHRMSDGKLLIFYLDPNEEVRVIEEVEEICRAVMDGHAEVSWIDYSDEPTPMTMGKVAADILASIKDVDVRRLAVGQAAPEVSASDSNGAPLKLSGFRGKVVLLSFGGQHCIPCIKMIPHERDLLDRLKGRPFALVGFDRSEGEAVEDLKQFLKREKVTWPVCPGRSKEGWDVFRTWNINAIPVFYLIDDRGVIRLRFDGYTEPDLLSAAVESLVRETENRVGSP